MGCDLELLCEDLRHEAFEDLRPTADAISETVNELSKVVLQQSQAQEESDRRIDFLETRLDNLAELVQSGPKAQSISSSLDRRVQENARVLARLQTKLADVQHEASAQGDERYKDLADRLDAVETRHENTENNRLAQLTDLDRRASDLEGKLADLRSRLPLAQNGASSAHANEPIERFKEQLDTLAIRTEDLETKVGTLRRNADTDRAALAEALDVQERRTNKLLDRLRDKLRALPSDPLVAEGSNWGSERREDAAWDRTYGESRFSVTPSHPATTTSSTAAATTAAAATTTSSNSYARGNSPAYDNFERYGSPERPYYHNGALGRDRWHEDKFGLGWWAISWPEERADKQEWGADGAWHVDGAHFAHRLDSAEQALLPIFLFSDIGPECGGTALASGSHVAVTKVLMDATPEAPQGLPGSQVSKRAMRIPGALDQPVEVRGKAGDVALCHPFLLHARGKNFAPTEGTSGVRFIANPCVQFRERMRVGLNADAAQQCPIERAISEAQMRAMLPLGFGSFGNPPSKRRRRR
ncbi:Hypothetical Protein FCC1311_079542 [Hondaea fermentalgiana]|uniref:Uncharacterized protein n=1 Tax=Hondaea fermentalgiana TaxID=2315210 RepID=A0A2R5GN54_9STRA|nr:Hypothetical Protein FCC1311_079542 [Hondaea fermentalgiana]|eukprot:GBG31729.1 Hypothetical Protein FCC1311_079542 [Hondaea fermentalgiana]